MATFVFFDSSRPSDAEESRLLANALSGDSRSDWDAFQTANGLKIVRSYPEKEEGALRAAAEAGQILLFLCPVPWGMPRTCLAISEGGEPEKRNRKLSKLLELGKRGFPLMLDSFLASSGQRLMALGGGNEILALYPDRDFLGFQPTWLMERNFTQVFSCGAYALGSLSSLGRKSLELRSRDGTPTQVDAISLPPEALPLLDPGSRSGGYLLLSPLPAQSGGSEAQACAPGDDQASKRACELEAANEMLLVQAQELKNALDLLEYRNSQMIQELALASELQKSLLPKDYPQGIPLEFSHKYIPLSDVGGDFFDVVRVDERHVGIVITDVSGHGVAPAFITAMFKSSFNHYAPGEPSPAAVMNKLNKEFSRTLRTEHYLTGFYAVIDTESLECVYCNAGHPKQLLLRQDGAEEELGTMGFFIGMFEKTEYEDKRIHLKGGDCLCLFTDGIVETHDGSGRQFGREGIVRTIRSRPEASLAEQSDTLITELIQYMVKPEFEDDITFIAARVIESL